MAEPTPEEMAAMQKEQCPFCKIIRGEIPSKKVYEDDLIIAVLDINPATKGHVLVMPKEHYGIMPLVPPETMAHLFKKVPGISKAVRESTLAQGSTVFIANGAVAGQQAQHFLLHIIPRDPGDKLETLNVPKNEGVDKAKISQILGPIAKNIFAVLQDRQQKYGLESQAQIAAEAPQGPPDLQQVIQIVNDNPPIRDMIKNNPEGFKQAIEQNPQLKAIFGQIDLKELSEALNK